MTVPVKSDCIGASQFHGVNLVKSESCSFSYPAAPIGRKVTRSLPVKQVSFLFDNGDY